MAILLTVAAALLVPPVAWADDATGVVPPDGKAWGRTYGELARDWWIWANRAPADQDPISDPDGSFGRVGQNGKIWFLAGNSGGDTLRVLTMPADKALFFPIMNVSWIPYASDPLPGEEGYVDGTEARAIVNWYMDLVYDVACTMAPMSGTGTSLPLQRMIMT